MDKLVGTEEIELGVLPTPSNELDGRFIFKSKMNPKHVSCVEKVQTYHETPTKVANILI